MRKLRVLAAGSKPGRCTNAPRSWDADCVHEVSITAGDFDGVARGCLQYPGDLQCLAFRQSPSEFVMAAYLYEDRKAVADLFSCMGKDLGHDPKTILC